MNHAAATEESRNDFATAVQNFPPALSPKFRILSSFKEGIAELRRKGASYETIAEILRNINVIISHDTVAEFCHKVLEIPPAKRRKRKQSVRAVAHRPSSGSPKRNDTHSAHRGPRIADPKNI
jgi:hypothetical protein